MSELSPSQFADIRQAMLKIPAYYNATYNATTLLASFDPQDPFLEATNMIVRAIQSDTKVKEIADAVLAWASKPIDPNLLEVYRRVRRPGTSGNTTFLSIFYLRLLEAFGTPSQGGHSRLDEVKSALANPSELLEKVKSGIAKADPGFIGHLLIETEIRAFRNADFADKLMTATTDINRVKHYVAEMVSKKGQTPVALLDASQLGIESQAPIVFVAKVPSPDDDEMGGGSGGGCSTADDGTVCYVIAGLVVGSIIAGFLLG